ncbi:hypothetical protein AWC20_08975 [Mycobacterium parmense]|nr:hypothetical protein AWC20_08975 [Mycobacterium parmense]
MTSHVWWAAAVITSRTLLDLSTTLSTTYCYAFPAELTPTGLRLPPSSARDLLAGRPDLAGQSVLRIPTENWSTTDDDVDRSAEAIIAAAHTVSSQ